MAKGMLNFNKTTLGRALKILGGICGLSLVFAFIRTDTLFLIKQGLIYLAILTLVKFSNVVFVRAMFVIFIFVFLCCGIKKLLKELGIGIVIEKAGQKRLKKLILLMLILLVFICLAIWIFKSKTFLKDQKELLLLLLGSSAILIIRCFILSRRDFSHLAGIIKGLPGFSAAVSIVFFISVNITLLILMVAKKPWPHPNVILIVADALRADHLGCYGYKRQTSPNIDQFASTGLMFERAYTNASWTQPAIATLMSSLYPHEHGACYWNDGLSDRLLTLAEIFKNAGYKTMTIQTNPILSRNYGFSQGFDIYSQKNQARAEEVAKYFINWLGKNKKHRFFAYLHFMDTHAPYNVPEEYGFAFRANANQIFKAGQFKPIDVRLMNLIGLRDEDRFGLLGLYDGAIKYLDINFGLIMERLKELNLLDNTLIIFTSDHGEELFEHNNFDHGHSQYQEILRIPLIIGYGSKLNPDKIAFPVQLVDLMPIILQIAYLKQKPELFEGYNLTDIVGGKRKEVFSEIILLGDEKKALITDNWKLIENSGRIHSDTLELYGDITRYVVPELKENYELYDLSADPGEKFNLAESNESQARKLKAILRKYKVRSDLIFEPLKLKERRLEVMRSLGYIH
ncbi:MAG: sulfatase [Candidatus Saccharicenans sp.]|jgi:arylsulfatase A-like enzyme|nr:sulfatase-like hydrolase/transferase [Candidatus Saccharicenans sp.]MDH7575352.1 sulfatase [Candidatus Saccharicenans sp.]